MESYSDFRLFLCALFLVCVIYFFLCFYAAFPVFGNRGFLFDKSDWFFQVAVNNKLKRKD